MALANDEQHVVDQHIEARGIGALGGDQFAQRTRIWQFVAIVMIIIIFVVNFIIITIIVFVVVVVVGILFVVLFIVGLVGLVVVCVERITQSISITCAKTISFAKAKRCCEEAQRNEPQALSD